jgi:hypothetical protein
VISKKCSLYNIHWKSKISNYTIWNSVVHVQVCFKKTLEENISKYWQWLCPIVSSLIFFSDWPIFSEFSNFLQWLSRSVCGVKNKGC